MRSERTMLMTDLRTIMENFKHNYQGQHQEQQISQVGSVRQTQLISYQKMAKIDISDEITLK